MIQSKSDDIPVKVKSEQTPQISERIPFLFEDRVLLLGSRNFGEE